MPCNQKLHFWKQPQSLHSQCKDWDLHSMTSSINRPLRLHSRMFGRLEGMWVAGHPVIIVIFSSHMRYSVCPSIEAAIVFGAMYWVCRVCGMCTVPPCPSERVHALERRRQLSAFSRAHSCVHARLCIGYEHFDSLGSICNILGRDPHCRALSRGEGMLRIMCTLCSGWCYRLQPRNLCARKRKRLNKLRACRMVRWQTWGSLRDHRWNRPIAISHCIDLTPYVVLQCLGYRHWHCRRRRSCGSLFLLLHSKASPL